MSSVHKHPKSPYWFCAYRDSTGKRRFKSTRTNRRREAQLVCAKIQEHANRARAGHLTPDRARAVIESSIREILEASGASVEQISTRKHFTDWLAAFKPTCKPSTFARYSPVVHRFLDHLGKSADQPLPMLTAARIESYRAALAKRVAPLTVNTHLKVLRIALNSAVRQRMFDRNPARDVDNVSTHERHRRSAFTLDELKRLLKVAKRPWNTAILLGVYSGLRLGDICRLTWANVDFETEELSHVAKKTDKFQRIPIAKPLHKHLEAIAGDKPREPLCPGLAGKPVSWVSNQFHELLAEADLVESRGDHLAKIDKSGRASRRTPARLSFHSLRHTATSLLKNAGVSDVVARDLIGHESESVSRNYTHIDSATRRKAVAKLPDVTR